MPALVLTRRGRRSCGSHPVTNGVTRVSSSAPLTIVRRRVTGMHRVRGKIYAYILTETACVMYSVEVSTYDPQARFGRDHGRYRDRGLSSSLIEDCLRLLTLEDKVNASRGFDDSYGRNAAHL